MSFSASYPNVQSVQSKEIRNQTRPRTVFLIGCVVFLLTTLMYASASRGQPAGKENSFVELFVPSDRCMACHNTLISQGGQDVSIGSSWTSSMMANSARDPYWQASVQREVLAHPSAGQSIQDECAACHMPMARYQSKAASQKGQVFAHLPIGGAQNRLSLLAADGVSCTLCHQIQAEGLGTEASFTAGFVVDSATLPGKRSVFGPYAIDQGRTRIMQSASHMVPKRQDHIQDSELCASCHTLYTHTRGPDGEILGELPEQVPYLEWKHSAYAGIMSCQSCHMPQLKDQMAISSVLGQPREGFSRHVFRGGNFFMPKMLNRHRKELGVSALPQDLTLASRETEDHLQTSMARLSLEKVEHSGQTVSVEVSVVSMAGHKLPTAYPSRRVWIHLTVQDGAGDVVFESGGLQPDGSIQVNVNDEDRDRFEPHHALITRPDQVQIYEAIMADPQGNVTTGLIEAIRFVKDNRILPKGFDKATAHQDIQVQGRAVQDRDFRESGDALRYEVRVDPGQGPYTVQAELMYQPIAFRWAQNLQTQNAESIKRFVRYYDSMSRDSATVLARSKAMTAH